jgi:hypothetical protein
VTTRSWIRWARASGTHRRAELRAHRREPRRRRHRAGGTGAGGEARQRTRGLRPPHRAEPGGRPPADGLMDPPGVGSADGDARYDHHQNCGIPAAAAKYLAPRPASMPATGPCPPTAATPTRRNTT